MSYTDELIRQELERYKADDIPVNDDEVKFFKENIPSDSIETFKDMLVYVYGRSWYWSRLMQSMDFSEAMTPENLDNVIEGLMQRPQFTVGLYVAMYRLCGFKIEVVEEVSVVEKVIPAPKHNARKEGKRRS